MFIYIFREGELLLFCSFVFSFPFSVLVVLISTHKFYFVGAFFLILSHPTGQWGVSQQLCNAEPPAELNINSHFRAQRTEIRPVLTHGVLVV